MSVLKIKNSNNQWESVPTIKGETGVGVESIEQTTTSTESGGTNVITATLTDGTTSEFYIKNGEAGSGGGGGGGTSNYNELTNKPSINNITLTGNKTTSDLGINIPTATSDLTNDIGYITSSSLPTKVSDLTNDAGYITSYTETDPVFSSSAAAGITSSDITNWNNKSDFSGSYTDLTNKPTIPTVNNATLTIQKNGTTVNTFTANASSNVTANITVPTQTSELTNNSGFITSSALEDRPYYTSLYTVQDQSKPAGYYEVVSDFALDNSVTDAYIDSSAIKYKLNDNLEDIVDGKQNLITSTNKLDYSLLSNTPTIPTVPTNISSFTNDSGYITGITSSDVTTALGYTPSSAANIYQLSTIENITSASDTTYLSLKNDVINNRPIIIKSGSLSYNVLGVYSSGTGSSIVLWFNDSNNSCTKITLISDGTDVDVTVDTLEIPSISFTTTTWIDSLF